MLQELRKLRVSMATSENKIGYRPALVSYFILLYRSNNFLSQAVVQVAT